MNFRRFLRPDSIRLDLVTRVEPEGELADDFDPDSPGNLTRVREEVLQELTELLEAGGQVVNPSRLCRDLYYREKRTVTALGSGIALPHVRTVQVRSFTMAFGRSHEGLPFSAPDGEPVHLFFAMAAPPYDDRTYLRVYKSLAKVLLEPEAVTGFLEAQDPSEVLLVLKRFDL